MMLLLLSALLLSVAMAASPDNRFFISAPNVFHVGVKEKVFIQTGKNHLNINLMVYLTRENDDLHLSDTVHVTCTKENEGKLVELMLDQTRLRAVRNAELPQYAMVVVQGLDGGKRHSTKVLLSPHRGYIFIQTNQPLYKPMDTVQFRIFTLDHKFRPSEEVFHLSLYNAAGNRVLKGMYTTKEKGGIFENHFVIPDVAKTGIWRIVAHYEGDKAHAASKEFKVQMFVLPSFEVNIEMENKYILVSAKEEEINFRILARYTHKNPVNGAYHCQFGIIPKKSSANPRLIMGMEQTGSVKDGTASVSVNITKLSQEILNQKNLTLSDLEGHGEHLYLGVLVTDIQNGEIQEQKISIPVVSHKYRIDVSRTGSYYKPDFPFNVAVLVRLPDGSPAEKVPVTMTLMGQTGKRDTNKQGAVFYQFNSVSTQEETLTVSVDDSHVSKVIKAAESQVDLNLAVEHKEYTVGGQLKVTFETKNAPQTGFIHFLVLSRGSIVQTGHVSLRGSLTQNLHITENMVPSFRLIGYFYTQNNDIISDSVWLAAKDNCEDKVKITVKGQVTPGRLSVIDIDLSGQEATVALQAVDTAFNSLNVDNKLTQEQVYSSMEAYDLGCSYGGGQVSGSAVLDAGLAFATQNGAVWREDLNCHSRVRQKRSVDLEQEMMALKSKYEGEDLQSCCARGFLLIPMQWSCEERVNRVLELQGNTSCTQAFKDCCLEGQRLREQRAREEAKKGLGRTTSLLEIEEHFLSTDNSFIRKLFHSSFAFKSFPVNGKTSHSIDLPDSITTWELQVVTLSKASGLCVPEPTLLRAFKPVFVSLRLPTVRKYEQMYIAPVIYNYNSDDVHLAVHMSQSEGLCSPGSATSVSFVNITVGPESSQTVTFSAVPMISNSIPIDIRLYDIRKSSEVDGIRKTLNVLTEGVEKIEEQTIIIYLNGTNDVTRKFDGKLPDDTVPGSMSNIFISIEEDGFSSSRVRNLLNPEKAIKLIGLPNGCLEQTTRTLTPTAVAVRYLDMSNQWFKMPPNARDEAVSYIGKGVARITYLLRENKTPGAYGLWPRHGPSIWLTSHVVKVLSMVGKRQLFTYDEEGRKSINVPTQEITEGVRYLSRNQQEKDGSFDDPNSFLHRGILTGVDSKASMTAFAALALSHALDLLEEPDNSSTKSVISTATQYLWSNFNQLKHPLAIAITAYALAVRKEYASEVRRTINWAKFETTDKAAITVEATAYALLTAVALKEVQQAHKLAHWLSTQENFFSGFYSSQDTLVALEALSEYELMAPATSEANVQAAFTVQGKNDVEKLHMENQEKVEKDLKRFVGNDITAAFKGHGKAKVKVMKVYHLMEPKDFCDKLSIEVKVEGKVRYTAPIQDNYEYYDDDNTGQSDDSRVRRSAIEWFDIRTRRRREVIGDKDVTYEICVMHNPRYTLTGMAIIDLTLLSGFEADTNDLETLRAPPEQYISHYELSPGKVVIYLNELIREKQCFKFDAKQLDTVGLLQPVPAVFYDYYEPGQKCTVFYSAPRRSQMISTLCSGDVCQCAERPCHKIRNTFRHTEENRLSTIQERQDHACFYPLVDYAYMVTVTGVSEKNNFELYKTTVTEVLKIKGDHGVKIGSHRVFAKRRHCKGRLEENMEYLIMGKDGTTTDTHGKKQYLLDVNTWVEPKPSDCENTDDENACNGFTNFVEDFKTYSCKQ